MKIKGIKPYSPTSFAGHEKITYRVTDSFVGINFGSALKIRYSEEKVIEIISKIYRKSVCGSASYL